MEQLEQLERERTLFPLKGSLSRVLIFKRQEEYEIRYQ